ncbi:MAG TPA: SMP-30/gluconolactonase/LRE family protein [Jatrophihabitantaceae bacterium]|jgi:sugar lactone lactonase YvrE
MRIVAAGGYALAEGARWIDGRLVYVDILDGSLYSLDETGPNRLVHLDVPLGAAAPVAGGGWIVAAGPGIARLGPDGTLTWLDDGLEPPTSRMNDGCCDPQGRFWAGSMAYDETPGAGSLYRADASGAVTRVFDGLTIVNGPAFSADGAVMYVADTAAGVIYRCDGDGGDRRTFAEIPPAEGFPDGLTVDDTGRLWVALWGGSAVRCYGPDGTVERQLDVPAPQPTSVCLADGALYVTTAAIGLTDPGPASGAVLAIEVDATAPPAFSYTAGL